MNGDQGTAQMPVNMALQSDTCKRAAFSYANPRSLTSAAELGS